MRAIKKREDTFEEIELTGTKGATLLCSWEVNKYLTKSEREYNNSWWLKDEGRPGCPLAVSKTGMVSDDGELADRTDFCVRPALEIENINILGLTVGDVFIINGYEFKVISKNYAWLCKQDIGTHEYHREEDQKNIKLSYDISDIKKLIDNWYKDNIININLTNDNIEFAEITGATILSSEQAERYLTEKEREYNNEWWLSTSDDDYCARCVSTLGRFSDIGWVEHNICVRPALEIENLDAMHLKVGDIFKVKDYSFKIISERLAWLYKQDIGNHCFNEEWDVPGANIYETSSLKKFVDNWFIELIYD